MRRRLAHSFGNRRAGDAVLSGGYPVCNALSRHPVSDQILRSPEQKGSPKSSTNSLGFVDGVGRASEARSNLTILWRQGRKREGGNKRQRQALRLASRLAVC